MTLKELKELKARYTFYNDVVKTQIEQAKYHQGFAYKPGNLEEVLAENEAVLKLIKKKEK